MKIFVENHMPCCGYDCHPDGCIGHDNGIPDILFIDDISFEIHREQDVNKVKETIDKLVKLIKDDDANQALANESIQALKEAGRDQT